MAEASILYAGIGLVIGLILGVVIARLMTPEYKKHKQVQKDLEKAKFELEQNRQELIDHFQNSANLLDDLGKSYTKLYQHLQKTSSELLPNLPQQDNPFIEARLDMIEDEADEKIVEVQGEPPRDYAQGSSGVFHDKPVETKDKKDDATKKVEPAPKKEASA